MDKVKRTCEGLFGPEDVVAKIDEIVDRLNADEARWGDKVHKEIDALYDLPGAEERRADLRGLAHLADKPPIATETKLTVDVGRGSRCVLVLVRGDGRMRQYEYEQDSDLVMSAGDGMSKWQNGDDNYSLDDAKPPIAQELEAGLLNTPGINGYMVATKDHPNGCKPCTAIYLPAAKYEEYMEENPVMGFDKNKCPCPVPFHDIPVYGYGGDKIRYCTCDCITSEAANFNIAQEIDAMLIKHPKYEDYRVLGTAGNVCTRICLPTAKYNEFINGDYYDDTEDDSVTFHGIPVYSMIGITKIKVYTCGE